MKRVVKYILLLSVVLSVIGFAIGVHANGKQGVDAIVSDMAIEEKLIDFDMRLSEIEQLSKDEIMQYYIESEDRLSSRVDTIINIFGSIMTVLSILVAICGVIMPFVVQSVNNKRLREAIRKLKEDQQELKQNAQELNDYIADTKNRTDGMFQGFNEKMGVVEEELRHIPRFTDDIDFEPLEN